MAGLAGLYGVVQLAAAAAVRHKAQHRVQGLTAADQHQSLVLLAMAQQIPAAAVVGPP